MINALDIEEAASEACKRVFQKLIAKGVEPETAIALVEPLEVQLRELMEEELLADE